MSTDQRSAEFVGLLNTAAIFLRVVEPEWSRTLSRLMRQFMQATSAEQRVVMLNRLGRIYDGPDGFGSLVLPDGPDVVEGQRYLDDLKGQIYEAARRMWPDSEGAMGRRPTYRPESGVGMALWALGAVVAGFVYELKSGDLNAWLVVLFGAFCVGSLLLAVKRRRAYRSVDGSWPDLPEGVHEPREPLKRFSGDPAYTVATLTWRANTGVREPFVVAFFGAVFASTGIGIVLDADAPDRATYILGGVYVILGGAGLATSLVRWWWMHQYKKVVGHLPW